MTPAQEAPAVWGWRKRIAPAEEARWTKALDDFGCRTWTLTEKPGWSRLLLAVYSDKEEELTALRLEFGGRIVRVATESWLPSGPTPPTRISAGLEIVHDLESAGNLVPEPKLKRLIIPHGLAFGSGEHGTTFMLLRDLARRPAWQGARVLDLGTGTGVLALAARLFGAARVKGTDFDPAAIHAARENEARNFSDTMIDWQCEDVLRLSPKMRAEARYDLVLANIFSEILCQAAPRIRARVGAGGELWLSGILRAQMDEVRAAYERQGLQFTRAKTRGKWVMLQFLAGAA